MTKQEFKICEAVALGLICFFIGFFFGRVTKNRIEMKKDECKTYEDIIDREG